MLVVRLEPCSQMLVCVTQWYRVLAALMSPLQDLASFMEGLFHLSGPFAKNGPECLGFATVIVDAEPPCGSSFDHGLYNCLNGCCDIVIGTSMDQDHTVIHERNINETSGRYTWDVTQVGHRSCLA